MGAPYNNIASTCLNNVYNQDAKCKKTNHKTVLHVIDAHPYSRQYIFNNFKELCYNLIF